MPLAALRKASRSCSARFSARLARAARETAAGTVTRDPLDAAAGGHVVSDTRDADAERIRGDPSTPSDVVDCADSSSSPCVAETVRVWDVRLAARDGVVSECDEAAG